MNAFFDTAVFGFVCATLMQRYAIFFIDKSCCVLETHNPLIATMTMRLR